ncbi:hypothetical protein POTOM_047326 [Populus tomentosa]|uniref:Uncharacterized protein n=1 Tax=Populus tomentosa TaxID=118781 RepID=A0A8X8CDH5_POPTO|nr:hypothetical protein POTOM_047326 [Populus tomentosa]
MGGGLSSTLSRKECALGNLLRETGSAASGSSTSLPMHISISLSKCAPFVHAPASHEHSLFKDNRPLICKRRVGRTFSMDIEESLVYVPPIEEVYEDVSPIKEKNAFIPLVEDTRCMEIRDSDVEVVTSPTKTLTLANPILMFIGFSIPIGVEDGFSNLNLGFRGVERELGAQTYILESNKQKLVEIYSRIDFLEKEVAEFKGAREALRWELRMSKEEMRAAKEELLGPEMLDNVVVVVGTIVLRR